MLKLESSPYSIPDFSHIGQHHQLHHYGVRSSKMNECIVLAYWLLSSRACPGIQVSETRSLDSCMRRNDRNSKKRLFSNTLFLEVYLKKFHIMNEFGLTRHIGLMIFSISSMGNKNSIRISGIKWIQKKFIDSGLVLVQIFAIMIWC